MQDLTTLVELPLTVTVREVQRNYRKIFNRVKSTKKPVVVLCRGQPEVAIVSLKFLQEIAYKLKGTPKVSSKEEEILKS